MQDIQSAEEEGREHADVRLPDRKDDERDGKPAAVAERIVGPDAAGVVHDVVQSAEAGDHAADAGGDVLILIDVDAGSVGRLRIFADGAQVQAHARVLEHISGNERNGHGEVGEKTVGQEDLAKPAELRRERQRLGKVAVRGRERNGRHLAAGELDERAAHEVAEADAERRHGKAGDVLVGAQRNGEKAVQQTHEQRAEQARQQRDHDGEKAVHPRGPAGRLLIQERPDDAADAADIHDARDAEVEVAGLFGERFAGAAEQQRDTLHDGAGDKGHKIKHAPPPPSSPTCGSSAGR